MHELHHASAAFAFAQSEGHALHDEAQTGVFGGAVGHAQEAGGGAFPSAGHGFEHLEHLRFYLLREGLVHLLLIGVIGIFYC